LVKDEIGGLLADSHNILNRWKNYFCLLFNVYGINDVRQIETHPAEPLTAEASSYEARLLMEIWKVINPQVLTKF
jgi:hypothetical protein